MTAGLARFSSSVQTMSKVFFANSGSEANDSAVKLVWYYFNAIGQPQKKKLIARERGYAELFARTGGAYVFRTVHFPWSEPERWS